MDYKKRYLRDDFDDNDVDEVKNVINLLEKHERKIDYAIDYLNDALKTTDNDEFYEKVEEAYAFLNRVVYYFTRAKNDLNHIKK